MKVKEIHKRHFTVYGLIVGTILCIYSFIILAVLIWGFLVSMKPQGEFFTNAYPWWKEFDFKYLDAITTFKVYPSEGFGRAYYDLGGMFINSITYSIACAFVSTISPLVMAYVAAKYKYKFSGFLPKLVLTVMVIPGEVNIIANYMTIQSLGLMDTYAGMTITSLVNISGMFMLRQHMMTLPKSLWEAAKMDGCSEMRYFVKIVVPLSKSIIAAQVLNSFIWIYNSYLWPLLVTSTENMRTIQTGIANLVRDMYWNPGGALAGAIVCMIIPVVIYIIGLDQIVSGLTSGAVKD